MPDDQHLHQSESGTPPSGLPLLERFAIGVIWLSAIYGVLLALGPSELKAWLLCWVPRSFEPLWGYPRPQIRPEDVNGQALGAIAWTAAWFLDCWRDRKGRWDISALRLDLSQLDTRRLQRLLYWSIMGGAFAGGALGVYGWVTTVRGLVCGVAVAGIACLAAGLVTDVLARPGSGSVKRMLIGASVLSALYLAGVLAAAIFILASGRAHMVRPL